MRLINYLSKKADKKDDFFRLLLNSDFEKDVARIRKMFDINPLVFESFNEERLWIRLMENNDLRKEVRKILKKHKCSEQWEDQITQYVIDEDFIPPNDTDPDGLRLEMDSNLKDVNHPEYALIINNGTTIRDIKKAWPLVQRMLVRDRKRNKRPWKNFWRDYQIYQLSQKYSYKEVASLIARKYGVLDIGLLKKIVSEFRSKIGIKNKVSKG